MRKVFRIVLVSCAILALGISARTLVSKGTFSCAAEDIREPAASQAALPAPAAPEAKEPTPAPVAAADAAANPRYDFSDSSSWNLTVSGWEYLAQKDYAAVAAYAGKCLELYEEKAREAAKSMSRFAAPGHEDDFALVNDVATAHYILGEAAMRQGKNDEAIREFELVIAGYPYAQCWDPKGWFWKVAEISRKNIDKINKTKAGGL